MSRESDFIDVVLNKGGYERFPIEWVRTCINSLIESGISVAENMAKLDLMIAAFSGEIKPFRYYAKRWKWTEGKVRQLFIECGLMQAPTSWKSYNTSTTQAQHKHNTRNGEIDEKSDSYNTSTTQAQHKHNTVLSNTTNTTNTKEEYTPQKKPKPDKLSFAEFVTMTKDEYEKLVTEHGETATKWMIEKLNNHKGASGKKYKSDYMAILNWVVEAYQKQKGTINATPQQHNGRLNGLSAADILKLRAESAKR